MEKATYTSRASGLEIVLIIFIFMYTMKTNQLNVA